MEFGMQFFPDVTPEQKSGAQYFDECLRLAELGDSVWLGPCAHGRALFPSLWRLLAQSRSCS